ncbi:2' O-ribose methyltransferase [Orbilia brochopaga]|uniref:rRNA methyltransferase 2, mitochondrial n=1 Tax=Orbilia brochopaga TaxID=3140254 RepID=A0AAV9VD82_9PEZI
MSTMISRRYLRLLTDLALNDTPVFGQYARHTRSRLSLSSSCLLRQQRQFVRNGNAFVNPASRQFSTTAIRVASKKKNKLWLMRQSQDYEAQEAKVMMYKSRAAFKLLQIDDEFKLLKPGITVVDLGYAPGSWSQVAVAKTTPGGRVVGIDLLPAPPPKGASSIQGNFLDPGVQASIRRYLSDPARGRARVPPALISTAADKPTEHKPASKVTPPVLELDNTASQGYIAQERRDSRHDEEEEKADAAAGKPTQAEKERNTVDVVLSDMLMNTSGVSITDHARSMELCYAALKFCIDVLKPGGHFVCKFYQGSDDNTLFKKLEKAFTKVNKVKPDASREESKELYFVAQGKRPGITRAELGLEKQEVPLVTHMMSDEEKVILARKIRDAAPASKRAGYGWTPAAPK